MVTIQVTLPDRIDSDIDRLVEQGDFLNRDQAIEELLALGVSTHDTTDKTKEGLTGDIFTQAVDNQEDPANQRDDSL